MYKLAVKADPDNSKMHTQYGALLSDVREGYDCVKRKFKLTIKTDPDNSIRRLNLAIVRLKSSF